jgi:hypothetical protein
MRTALAPSCPSFRGARAREPGIQHFGAAVWIPGSPLLRGAPE